MAQGIDPDGLRGFVTIVELGSFHAAATALAARRSRRSAAASRRLEEVLGFRLLARTTRRVAPTPAGRDFLPRARRLLEQLDEALLAARDLRARQAGRVTVACVPSVAYYFLPLALRRFHAQFPEVQVRILEDSAAAVLQLVRDGEAEAGISFLGQADEDLEFVPVIRDPFVLACRTDHPARRGRRSCAGAS